MIKSEILDKLSYYLIGLTFMVWIFAFLAPNNFLGVQDLTKSPFSTFTIVDIIPKVGLGLFFFSLARRKVYASLASAVLVAAFPISFAIRWFIIG